MFRFKFRLLGLALLVTTQIFAQTEHLNVVPQKPVPGQTVQITYDPTGTPLAGMTGVRAVVYAFNNYKWQTSDLNMVPKGTMFKASLTLDKSCGIAVFKFLAGNSTDNNHDLGYAVMAIDPHHQGVNATGAYAGWGFLRAENRGYGIPGYYQSVAISDTAFYYWMNNEIAWHPEASQVISVPFVRAIYAYKGEQAMPRINRVIAYLTNTGGEANFLRVRQIYLQVLHRKASADSLDSVLLVSYPNGSIARLRAYHAFTSEHNLDKMQQLCVQFLNDFPQTTDAGFDEQNFISYGNAYQTAVILSVMKGDYTQLGKYIDKMPLTTLINLYYKIIQIPHDRKDLSDAKLLPYARMLVSHMEQFKNVVPPENWYLSPLEWQATYERYAESSVLPVQVNILRNTDNDDEALAYATRAEEFFQYKKAAVNDDYAYLLNKSGQYDKLHDVLVKSMYENQSTPEMIALLKADYIRTRNTSDGFEGYMNTLKNPALLAAGTADIKSQIMNAKMPDWSMTDASGKVIKLSELRGKTIVMDFWATWCVPCKASFPGMKLAVERYKNNPDVVFYFVDTEERTAGYQQQVAAYMKDNNYPFRVLFDNQVKGEKLNDEVFGRICQTFQISGIPLKMVIDAKGTLRFMTDGYKGSPTALADEIANMVELAKKAN